MKRSGDSSRVDLQWRMLILVGFDLSIAIERIKVDIRLFKSAKILACKLVFSS